MKYRCPAFIIYIKLFVGIILQIIDRKMLKDSIFAHDSHYFDGRLNSNNCYPAVWMHLAYD